MKKIFGKYFWDLLIVILAGTGLWFAITGMQELPNTTTGYSIYESFRMFLLNRQFEAAEWSCKIHTGSWLTLAAFALFSGRIIIRFLLPRAYRSFYFTFRANGHVVICGLNELTMSLINKIQKEKIVVITANKNNINLEGLKERGITVIEGNPNDTEVLKQVSLNTAAKVHIIKKDDRTNVEIAYKVYEILKTKCRRSNQPLKCFVTIQDRELKKVLQESPLFNETGKNSPENLDTAGRLISKLTGRKIPQLVFDCILVNIAEAGIHYGLNKQLATIGGNLSGQAPSFLIINLNKDAEDIILNLAHGITAPNKKISFTVFEKKQETITCFQIRHPYLKDFVDIQYEHMPHNFLDAPEETREAIKEKINQFSAIFFCFDNGINNLKAVSAFSRVVKGEHPALVTFCHDPESISEVMKISGSGSENFLQTHNIHIINTFDETFDYIFELDQAIEGCAAKAHEDWREDNPGNPPYNELSEHFKQSNRNQVIDNFYKMYLLGGQQLHSCKKPEKDPDISEETAELMAEMEHRRWMIEKLRQGWTVGDRDNQYKLHPDLLSWKELEDQNKKEVTNKDRKFIKFMITTLKNNFTHEQ